MKRNMETRKEEIEKQMEGKKNTTFYPTFVCTALYLYSIFNFQDVPVALWSQGNKWQSITNKNQWTCI